MENNKKFRAWQDGQMLHQAGYGNYAIARFIGFLYEDAPLMQYTGLKDKNGIEIYEGDIMKFGKTVSFVVWCLDQWRFNSYMEKGSLNLYNYVDKTFEKECAEIIGNIYESPDLLKNS